MFEYYVLNEERMGNHGITYFNIFDNWLLDEAVQKEVRKYLRSPKKYNTTKRYPGQDDVVIYGFEAFCEELRRLIAWQERWRCEYEIAVGSIFTTEIRDVVRDLDKYETLETLKEELIKLDKRNGKLYKIDCYTQCEKNIEMIAREVIYQWKHRDEEKKNVNFKEVS